MTTPIVDIGRRSLHGRYTVPLHRFDSLHLIVQQCARNPMVQITQFKGYVNN